TLEFLSRVPGSLAQSGCQTDTAGRTLSEHRPNPGTESSAVPVSANPHHARYRQHRPRTFPAPSGQSEHHHGSAPPPDRLPAQCRQVAGGIPRRSHADGPGGKATWGGRGMNETNADAERACFPAWIEALLVVARHYRLNCSEENLRVQAAWSAGQGRSEMLGRLARQIGLGCRLVPFDPQQVSAWRLPLVVELDDGQVGVIETLAADGSLSVRWSGDGGLHSTLT